MLRQLLALLEAGDTWSITDLASELDISPDLVNAMLSHLAQSGKLDMPEQTCAGKCAGCSLVDTCKIGPTDRMFVYASRAPKPSRVPHKRRKDSLA
ncbi:MAG: hypothetical protein JXB07_08150 [Anaerolineae bacterium]|nr:hypothetical protein [Anaerolineae bacterium]